MDKEERKRIKKQKRILKEGRRKRLESITLSDNKNVEGRYEKAFVFGNGVTRQEVDPNLLVGKGTVYGCNYFYEDFVPDVLVAVDMAIANHIQRNGYTKENLMYTREPVKWFGPDTKVKKIVKNYGFSSGPAAVTLACEAGHNYVYLIGMDLMGIGKINDHKNKRKINNIYSGREFYKKEGSDETHYGNWISQIANIMAEFQYTKFIRVNPHLDYNPPEWIDMHNFKSVTVKHFLNSINT